MQYEDSRGTRWTQYGDQEGLVYFFNERTMESAWELPEDAKQITPDLNSKIESTDAQDASGCWIQLLDESTLTPYFINTATQETSWKVGEDERETSNLYDHDYESYQPPGVQPLNESPEWRCQVLVDFKVPLKVPETLGKTGAARVWPMTVDGEPARLERWNVLKAADPCREHFVKGDVCQEDHPGFEPKLCFYAFAAAIDHVEWYWIEEAEAPFRSRLSKQDLRFSRDITKWEKRRVYRRHSDECKENEATGGTSGDTGEEGEGEGTGFFAFPLVVHSSHAHHVDWTSGPDRYQITQDAEPEWGWSRLFTFFAYGASKYHVLETISGDLPGTQHQQWAQKVVKGHFLVPEKGWKCVLAFYAFDSDVPGSNRYFVEEKDEPYLRMRVGLEASSLWESRHSFAAFDIPVPGSCAIDVHFIIRSADTLTSLPEQCRMSLKKASPSEECTKTGRIPLKQLEAQSMLYNQTSKTYFPHEVTDILQRKDGGHPPLRWTLSKERLIAQSRILSDPWGLWEQKFRFYAFPASSVLLSDGAETS